MVSYAAIGGFVLFQTYYFLNKFPAGSSDLTNNRKAGA